MLFRTYHVFSSTPQVPASTCHGRTSLPQVPVQVPVYMHCCQHGYSGSTLQATLLSWVCVGGRTGGKLTSEDSELS